MTDELLAREVAMTAELIRQRLEQQVELGLIAAAAVPMDVDYSPQAVGCGSGTGSSARSSGRNGGMHGSILGRIAQRPWRTS